LAHFLLLYIFSNGKKKAQITSDNKKWLKCFLFGDNCTWVLVARKLLALWLNGKNVKSKQIINYEISNWDQGYVLITM